MNQNNRLTQQSSNEDDQRTRHSDRRRNIERRKQNDPDYDGPYRRMEPDRRMRVLDRREVNRISSEETRFELKIF